MSHLCGWVVDVSPDIHIGPDSPTPATGPNTWQHDFSYLATGTKFVVLHFMNVTLPASNRLEVDLGYDTDVFSAADGVSFWTRPVNIFQLPGSTIPIRYITNGSNSGGVFLDRYGRGQSLPSVEPGFDSITNCDPFLPGPWVEPDFPHIPGSTAPKYEPFWICDKSNPPVWENTRCALVGSVQRDVSRSAGMILSIHEADTAHPEPYVSTCSVTLIDSDLVALAAHCITDHPFSLPASSVTFDYEVACDGSLVPAYDAVFYKVIGLVKYRYSDQRDYAILQLRGAPPVPPVPVRNGAPAVGEAVFGIHHPNGAVKKVSPSGGGTVPVQTTGIRIGVNLDVAGGSSGSGLFDLSGRLLGVLSNGAGCGVSYSSGALMLDDPIDIPDPPAERAVMLVIDRSGSMSEPAAGGGVKIDEARDAAELFISVMRASLGNEAGLVSFASDASSPVDFPIDPLTEASRSALLGVLPGIGPGGRTSIGDGLAAARNQLNTTSGLPRTILLLTDGMQNEPQAISDVGGLASTEITAIGFGTESNLDGPRLTDLAQTHGGYYKRAGTGLELRKFFALAFGDIFEAGALADPGLHLSETMRQGPWVPFHVCGEEAITVIVGWDNPAAPLLLEVRTPSGQVLDLSGGGIETDAGQSWRFARIPLPQNGERDGTWTARVLRPGSPGSEFPPPARPLDYFINVVARGGPSLRPYQQPRRLYTGDVLHPKVIFQYPDETVPPGGEVSLTVRRPDTSVGTVLSKAGLGAPRAVAGDVIPARQATLSRIETDSGAPVTSYVEVTYNMSNSGAAAETFKPAGIFGVRLTNALVVEGSYTFHARAQLHIDGCTLTREVQWSHHVSVGIDPDSTGVTVTPSGDGGAIVTFVPQDRYGNLVGPGAGDDLDATPVPGCTAAGGLVDLGDGGYRLKLDCDPDGEDTPGIVVTQPGRDPVVLVPPMRTRTLYHYPVQLHCGIQEDCRCECVPVPPGRYATSISIFNGSDRLVSVLQSLLPTTLAGANTGSWPEAAGIRARQRIELGSMQTSVVDCCSVLRLVLGAQPQGQQPLTSGTVLIESPSPLHVTATYTLVTGEGAGSSIDVEVIEPQRHVVREPVKRPQLPVRVVQPESRSTPPPRPQDLPRRRDDNCDKDYQGTDTSDTLEKAEPNQTRGQGSKHKRKK
jgi:hypothetical protein